MGRMKNVAAWSVYGHAKPDRVRPRPSSSPIPRPASPQTDRVAERRVAQLVVASPIQALGLRADTCRMRWTLLAIFGAVLMAVGIAGLGIEIAHGSDIWRKGNGGIALLVIGGLCVWHGLAERERGLRNKPLWPTLIWLTILLAIGVVLYLVAPPLAFLYAIVVGVIVRFSLLASWLDRE
jgi:hypothetical protein